MGKLLDAVKAKLDALNVREQEQAPDYKADPNKALDYIKRRNAVEYERTATGKKLVQALRKLPKPMQERYYDMCIQPAARESFTKERYFSYLDPNGRERNQHKWLLNDNRFGQSWQRNIEVLEQLLGPAEIESLSAEIENIVAPTDPAFPEEEKLVYPMTDEIEEIKNSLDPFAPDTIRDLDILEEVKNELAYVADDVREQLNKIDHSVENVTGYQTMVNRAAYDMQNRFIEHDFEEGGFKDKFATFASSEATAGHFYVMTDTELSEDGNFKQQDLDKIRKVKPNISDGLKNDILSVTGKLEQLGEDSFKNGYTTIALQDGGGKWIFSSEQGFKHYAYWPLDSARKKLEAAVKSKNMERIREAHGEYKELRKTYDEMLTTVQKHPTGLSTGNINSTRALPGGAVNPLPLNHMEDFSGHSRVNGLFCLYALGKNTQTSPAELLDDPVNAMHAAGIRYTQERGLLSRGTSGEKLFWGLSDKACDNFVNMWTMQTAQLADRAFSNVACMAGDSEERARIAGAGQLAIAAGSVHINAHKKSWERVHSCSGEQRDLLLQHAVLLPAEEFDPIAYGEEFAKPDWKQRLDTDALIARLKQEGKFDYGRLADRVEEIAEEARRCSRINAGQYSRDRLIEASRKLFKDIISKATPQERETEGFKKLEKYTSKMRVTTDYFRDEQRELESLMDVQLREKKGLFLSSTNSDEHDRMVRCQNTFRFKLMQMQGKPLPEGVSEQDKQYLRSISLKEAYDKARIGTFDYIAKKTDNGCSTHFVHNVGSDRYEAAMDALDIMDQMADELELRSPAQKLIDETRLEVLNGRRGRSWTNEKAEKAAAKLMYGMTVAFKEGRTPEQQQNDVAPQKVEMAVAYIRGRDDFKQMVKNEGLGKLMDKMMEGNSKFTDAYVKGMNDAARKRHEPVGKAPQDMQPEEKSGIWKNNQLPV